MESVTVEEFRGFVAGTTPRQTLSKSFWMPRTRPRALLDAESHQFFGGYQALMLGGKLAALYRVTKP
jgi:hypothetical protein